MAEIHAGETMLATDLYLAEAPVLVPRLSLGRGENSEILYLRLSLVNLASTPLQSARIKVSFYPAESPVLTVLYGELLSPDPVYQNQLLGKDYTLSLGVSGVSGLEMAVLSVTTCSQEKMELGEEPWRPLPPQPVLYQTLGDPLLVASLQTAFDTQGLYTLVEDRKSWRCMCGAFNLEESLVCRQCGIDLAQLRTALQNPHAFLRMDGNHPLPKKQKLALILLGACLAVLLILLLFFLLWP